MRFQQDSDSRSLLLQLPASAAFAFLPSCQVKEAAAECVRRNPHQESRAVSVAENGENERPLPEFTEKWDHGCEHRQTQVGTPTVCHHRAAAVGHEMTSRAVRTSPGCSQGRAWAPRDGGLRRRRMKGYFGFACSARSLLEELRGWLWAGPGQGWIASLVPLGRVPPPHCSCVV